MQPTTIPLRAQLLRVRLTSGRALLIPIADLHQALAVELLRVDREIDLAGVGGDGARGLRRGACLLLP